MAEHDIVFVCFCTKKQGIGNSMKFIGGLKCCASVLYICVCLWIAERKYPLFIYLMDYSMDILWIKYLV